MIAILGKILSKKNEIAERLLDINEQFTDRKI